MQPGVDADDVRMLVMRLDAVFEPDLRILLCEFRYVSMIDPEPPTKALYEFIESTPDGLTALVCCTLLLADTHARKKPPETHQGLLIRFVER